MHEQLAAPEPDEEPNGQSAQEEEALL